MQGDLARGNRLELPWLSGAVVAMGKKLGVPTPLNRAVSDILALYANGTPRT
jgi:2-dehydropantoate 2-reductase